MHYTLRVSALSAFAIGFLLVLFPSTGHAAQVLVSMKDYYFDPQSVTIQPGDSVVWVNNGNLAHTVVSDDGQLSSGAISVGQSFAAAFSKVGTYFYHDQYYGNAGGGGMAGTINVVASASVVPTYTAPVYTTPTYTTPTYTTTSNPSVAQLQAQVQLLLAQIQAMQGSVTGSTGTTITTTSSPTVTTYSASCPQISRSLKSGDSGDDVSRLQQFLARDTSVYPEAQVSGYFGPLTQAAVQRWQAKYNIVSSGTPESTGYGVVGPRTAAAISIICAGGSINGVSGASYTGTGTTPAQVGGFISVTPVSGTAPLTVNVTATVNTTASCSGATYTLTFGDNASAQLIPVASGNCGQLQQTYQHIYQYGGTYVVTLSAGSHSTTATVTVAGPAGPTIPSTGGSSSVPAGTISAFANSGNAPFTTTFYVSCVGGVAYNVVFGDGQDLGGSSVGQTKCDGSLQAVSHTYTSAGSYQAQLVLFVPQANGTVISQKWGTAQITVSDNSSSSGSSSGSYTYNPPVVQSGSSGVLSFTIQFDLPSSCTGYDLYWGDGTTHLTQADGGSSCSQTAVSKNFSHTYSSNGSYTIQLKRGASLARSDDVSVTISQ